VNAVLRALPGARASELDAATRPRRSALAHPRVAAARRCERRLAGASWPDIVAASNAAPPLTLRVNAARSTRVRSGSRARQPRGRHRSARLRDGRGCRGARPAKLDVARGFRAFAEGLVSVQDEGAQLAAVLLRLRRSGRAGCWTPAPRRAARPATCWSAMPTHAHWSRSTASAPRLARVQPEPRSGCSFAASAAACGDAAESRVRGGTAEPFERILVDAPCSGTGVIRRHPDIRILRNRGSR
jgi:16S rRNA (cytosine967-C5)-methyltransferase